MDQNLQQILEQQLRDVHLPEPVSWWPLAFGWWLLIAFGCIAIIAMLIFLHRKKQQNQYRKEALLQLDNVYSIWQQDKNTVAYLQSVNAVLKRSIQHTKGASHFLRLSGVNWVSSLNSLVKKPLSEQTQNALSIDCYQAHSDADVSDVQANATRWIKSHQATLINPNNNAGGQYA